MLRGLLFSLASLVFSCGRVESEPVLTARDQLVNEETRLADAKTDLYMAALGMIFADASGVVGTGCLQALVVRQVGPEELVFIDCLGEGEGRPARVIRLVARQRVSDTLANAGFEAASKIVVDRTETAIPAQDSRRLRALWWAMLQSARPSLDEARSLPRFHFSACAPLRACLAATTANPQNGTRPEGLTQLAELLIRLANSSADTKEAILTALRGQAAVMERSLAPAARRKL